MTDRYGYDGKKDDNKKQREKKAGYKNIIKFTNNHDQVLAQYRGDQCPYNIQYRLRP